MSDILIRLDRVINDHKQKKTDQSYSAKLLNEGVEKCAECVVSFFLFYERTPSMPS